MSLRSLCLWGCLTPCIWLVIAAQDLSDACLRPSGDCNALESRVEELESKLQAVAEWNRIRLAPGPAVPVFPEAVTGQDGSVNNPDRHVIARSEHNWSSFANFIVAVGIDSPITGIHLPQETPASGLEKHLFIGDANGQLHIFSMAGTVLMQHQTDGASPVTAIAEGKFSVIMGTTETPVQHDEPHRSNATHVVTGHANGCVRWHILEHSASSRVETPLDMHALEAKSFCPNSTTPDAEASIKLLTLGKVYPTQSKLAAVAVTEANRVLMLRDNGESPIIAHSGSPVHRVQLEHRQVQLLTEHGFSYVMLYSKNATVRPLACTGMNETRLVAAAPSLQHPARAYAVSSEGELIGLALAGQNRIKSCRVRLRRDVSAVGLLATNMAPNIAVLRAGALLTGQHTMQLINTTSSAKARHRTILNQNIANLPRSFGVWEVPELSGTAAVSVDVTGHILIQISDKIVALYEHPTPQVNASNPLDWVKWARPLMLLCMITFGVFQFSRRSRSYRTESAAAQLRPDLLRAQKQLLANSRRIM